MVTHVVALRRTAVARVSQFENQENMGRSLVIVESPAKAKTINKYLGRDYLVKASVGHVMDLPKKTIGIRLPGEDLNGRKKRKSAKGKKKAAADTKPKVMISIDDAKIFEPTLQIIAGKGKVINDLRKAASTADAVYLAGDPDREGEAISAHLAMVLSKPTRYAEEASSEKPTVKELAAAAEEELKKAKNGKGKKAKAKEKDEEITIAATDPKKIFRVTFNEICLLYTSRCV